MLQRAVPLDVAVQQRDDRVKLGCSVQTIPPEVKKRGRHVNEEMQLDRMKPAFMETTNQHILYTW